MRRVNAGEPVSVSRHSPSERRRRLLFCGLGVAALPALPGLVHAAGQRIVSVGGGLTETLYLLGAQAELVGVDTTSLFPAAARALPSVGYARSLSAEGVLSLAPSLIVATEDAGPPAVLRQIEAAKVPLHVLKSDHRIEGLFERTRQLGTLCGRDAAPLVAKLQTEWSAATDRVAALTKARSGPPPRVLFVMSHSPAQIQVAGNATGADAVIAYAGGRNAVDGGFNGYKPLTPEAAIAAAPDVILATTQGLEAVGGAANLLKAPGLAQTPAGRAQKVVAIDALLLLGFGPRLPAMVSNLAESLHTRS